MPCKTPSFLNLRFKGTRCDNRVCACEHLNVCPCVCICVLYYTSQHTGAGFYPVRCAREWASVNIVYSADSLCICVRALALAYCNEMRVTRCAQHTAFHCSALTVTAHGTALHVSTAHGIGPHCSEVNSSHASGPSALHCSAPPP